MIVPQIIPFKLVFVSSSCAYRWFKDGKTTWFWESPSAPRVPLDLVGVSGPCDDWISCYRLISLLFLLQEKNHWIGSRQLDWGKNGFPHICRHFLATPSYFKQTNKIRHFPCHFKTLGTNLKSSTVYHYKGLFAKTEWICPGLRLIWDDSRLQLTRVIPNNFY